MIETLYFGALQINVDCPEKINWNCGEMSFLTPTMPTELTANVSVQFVERIPKVPEAVCYESNGVIVWDEKPENRVYTPAYIADQRAAAYSSRDHETVRVSVLSRHPIWRNQNFHFLTMVHVETLLLDVSALILHACYTEYRGKAILFTAPSGTGKTTQAELWKRIYGSRIINGDKCLLQRTDKGYFACGFFLHGSAAECENESMPIDAVVIVRQSQKDYIEELRPIQKIKWLYSEITANHWNPAYVKRAMEILQELVCQTRVMMLHCTKMDSAAHVLHQYLYGDK